MTDTEAALIAVHIAREAGLKTQIANEEQLKEKALGKLYRAYKEMWDAIPKSYRDGFYGNEKYWEEKE